MIGGKPSLTLCPNSAGQSQVALLGITPRLQPPRPLLEEDALPALELMGRHLALARDRVEHLAAQEPQDQFRLPLDEIGRAHV